MLTRVLDALQASDGQIDLNELSERLQIDRYALGGMIEFWVHKGRIQPLEFEADCSSAACGPACPGAAECPLVATLGPAYKIPNGR